MSTNIIDIVLRASTSDLESGLDEATSKIGSFASSLLALAGVASGLALLSDFVSKGIELNSTLDSSRIGIASLITALSDMKDAQGNTLSAQETYNEALKISEEQLQKLRVAGLQTAATSEQLTQAYQQAVGAGMGAGLTLDEIRKVTVQTTQAASALGVPMDQLNQEVKALLSGNIDNNAVIAKSLGISSEMVKNWKEQGVLADKLISKMEAFAISGKDIAKTWEATKSNMEEAYSSIAAVMTKGLTDGLTEGANAGLSKLFDVENANLLSDEIQNVVALGEGGFTTLGNILGEAITTGIDLLIEFDDWLATNQDSVDGVTHAMGLVFEQLGSIIAGIVEADAMMVEWGVTSGATETVWQSIALTIALIRDGLSTLAGVFSNLLGLFISGGAELIQKLIYPITEAIRLVDGELADSINASLGNVQQFGSEYAKLGRDRINDIATGFNETSKVIGEATGKFSEFDDASKQLKDALKLPGLDTETKDSIKAAIKDVGDLRDKAKDSPQDFDKISESMRNVATSALDNANDMAAPFVEVKQGVETIMSKMADGSLSAADLTQKLKEVGIRDTAITKINDLNSAITKGAKSEADGRKEIATLLEKEILVRAGLDKGVSVSAKSKVTDAANKEAEEQKKIAVKLMETEIDLSQKVLGEKKKHLSDLTSEAQKAASERERIERKLADEVTKLNGLSVFKSTADKVAEIRRQSMSGAELEADLAVSSANKIAEAQRLIQRAEEERASGRTDKAKQTLKLAEDEAKGAESLSSRLKNQQGAIAGVTAAGSVLVNISKAQLEVEKSIESTKKAEIVVANQSVESEQTRLTKLKEQLSSVKEKTAKPETIKLVTSEAEGKIAGLKKELEGLSKSGSTPSLGKGTSNSFNVDDVKRATGVYDGFKAKAADVQKQADSTAKSVTTMNAASTKGVGKEAFDVQSVKQAEGVYSQFGAAAKKVGEDSKGVKSAMDETSKSIEGNAESVQLVANKAEVSMTALQKGIESVKSSDAKIAIDVQLDKPLSDIDALKRKLDEVLAYNGKVISVTIQQKMAQGFQSGGFILPAFATGGATDVTTGGKMPGYGGGDRRLVVVEDGEFVVNKERTSQYHSLLHAFNFGSPSDISQAVLDYGLGKYAMGGAISGIDFPAFKEGGALNNLAIPGINDPKTSATREEISKFELTLNGTKMSGLSGPKDQVDMLNATLIDLQRSMT